MDGDDAGLMTPPEVEAGFVVPFDEAEFDAEARAWAKEHPEPPAPPMANVALAVELATGLDAVRDYAFHGTTYRLQPTPYDVALRLLAWSQELERLATLTEVLHEHLPELRAAYVEIERLVGTLLVEPVEPNPFLEAEAYEVRALLGFALQTGNELPVVMARRTGDEAIARYDAAHYLYRYLEAFGGIRGMTVLRNGRCAPTSWKHFCQGMSYLRRSDAERALGLFGTVGATQTNEEGQERWLALQRREAGL